MVRIAVRRNGPYRVEGDDVTLVDWNGREYPPGKRPLALCRCGASATKPFCDKSHTRLKPVVELDAEGVGPMT
ncbi:MAG: iron-binding protein [Acidobacteria bacterium]|nr:iron-binding protein [Acidobacteriota bacterium]MBF83160.1 iron-binding protein [Acidobacteriota bacterium]